VEDAVRAHGESRERIDLLLTDVVLPDGSGVTLAERLLERDDALRVVYTTGHTDAEMTRHGLPTGQLMLVTKPFTEAELALVVRAALEAD
jgi:FixJ family two-component response regulator